LDNVKRICSHDEAIVRGLCPLKLDGEFLFAAEALPGVLGPDSRGLLPVRYVGAGFLLVRRDVFEKMLAAYGDEISYRADRTSRTEHDFWQVGVYRPEPGQPAHYMSEDWGFLQRAIDIGFKVFADTQVILKHIGPIPYPATSQEARWGVRLNEIVSKVNER
jgi:hypothetical protein